MTNRRAFLAASLAATATPAFARFPHELPEGLVFFVGNSFTRQHGIAELVCRIAAHSGVTAHCHRSTANGAHLADSMEFARSYSAGRGGSLPATVVLQDHSVAPLTDWHRQRSTQAISIYSEQFERTVLFETWPRRRGHPLYARPGMPTCPEGMSRLVHQHYATESRKLGAALAPVGTAWIQAMEDGVDLFAFDGYHANLSGAWLAAMMLAAALKLPDPYSAPAPAGIDGKSASYLSALAERHLWSG